MRRQDRYLESHWNQRIKRAGYIVTDFSQYKDTISWHLEYLNRLDAISQIVGKQNVIVRVYEKEQFEGKYHSVVSDFLSALGIEIDWNRCVLDKPINVALLGNYLEIKRKINHYLYLNDYICKTMDWLFTRFINSLYTFSEIKHTEGIFTIDERNKFLEKYTEENAEIARKYLRRSDGILFYDNEPIPLHKNNPDMLCSDIQNVLMFFFNDLEQGILMLCSLNNFEKVEDLDFVAEMQQLLHNIRDIKKNMLEKLENVQSKKSDDSQFETACFQIVEDYMLKIVEMYRKKYEIYNHIREYLKQKTGNREFYFFGTGGYCEDIIRELKTVPDAFLDNDKDKAGLCIHQKQIFHPTQIQDWKNCFILITVKKSDIICSIEQQLQQYGLKKDKDYIIAIEIFNINLD